MPEPIPAVNDNGDEVTPPAAPATTDNDTSAVSDPSADSDTLSDNPNDDDWLDDVDKAAAAQKLETESSEAADDTKAPAEGAETPEGDKPKEGEDADKPKEGDQPAADADKSDTDKPQPGKEARVEQLSKEISELKAGLGIEPNADVRALVAERNALKDMQAAEIRKAGLDLEKRLLNMTDPETGEAYTPQDAARIARSATIEAEGTVASQEAYDLGVQRNQQLMERETLKAMTDFPIFLRKLPDGTDNPEYDPELAELAGQHLNDAFVTEPVLDADGNPTKNADGTAKAVVVNIKRSPYEIMKSVADQATRLKSQSQADKDAAAAEAEAKAAANISRQAAGADVPVSGNTSSNRGDTAGADFDDEFDKY